MVVPIFAQNELNFTTSFKRGELIIKAHPFIFEGGIIMNIEGLKKLNDAMTAKYDKFEKLNDATINLYNKVYIEKYTGIEAATTTGNLLTDSKEESIEHNYPIWLNLIKHGVMLDPDLVGNLKSNYFDILSNLAVKAYGIDTDNINATFFQSRDQQKSTNFFSRVLLQANEYLYTYTGLQPNFTDVPIPRELSNTIGVKVDKVTYLKVMDNEGLENSLAKSIRSGIALSDKDVNRLFYLMNYVGLDFFQAKDIKNRQLKAMYFEKTGSYPENFDEFMRFINYEITRETQLVKNQDLYDKVARTLNDIKLNEAQYSYPKVKISIDDLVKILVQYDKKYGLATGIKRYNRYFLVLRKACDNKQLKHVINRAFKQSKKLYTARKNDNPLNNLIDYAIEPHSYNQEDIENASIYQLIRAVNYLSKQLFIFQNNSNNGQLYRVRNGKSFYRLDRGSAIKTFDEFVAVNNLRTSLAGRIFSMVHSLNQNKAYIVPDGVNYTLPTSQKKFVGNLPEGTTIDLGSNFNFGVSWNQKADLDLHLFSSDGQHFGWDSDWGDIGDSRLSDAISFSGDMTGLNSNGQAAEVYNLDLTGLVPSERYALIAALSFYASAKPTIPYNVIVTPGMVTDDHENKAEYINAISKNSLVFNNAEINHNEYSSVLGLVMIEHCSAKYVATKFNYGNVRVPGKRIMQPLMNTLDDNFNTQMSLETLIRNGAIKTITKYEAEDPLNTDEVIDLSLDKLSKDTFLKMLG